MALKLYLAWIDLLIKYKNNYVYYDDNKFLEKILKLLLLNFY